MNEFRVFLNDSSNITGIKEYAVASNTSMKNVVKTMAIRIINDEGLTKDKIERITFDTDAFSGHYECVITLADYCIAVWCQTAEPEQIEINDTKLAESLPDDFSIDKDDDETAFNDFFAKI